MAKALKLSRGLSSVIMKLGVGSKLEKGGFSGFSRRLAVAGLHFGTEELGCWNAASVLT